MDATQKLSPFRLIQQEDSPQSRHSNKQTVVFELRRAETQPVFGRVLRSQLLGRAEIPWNQVFESPRMETERWVSLVCANEFVREVESESSKGDSRSGLITIMSVDENPKWDFFVWIMRSLPLLHAAMEFL